MVGLKAAVRHERSGADTLSFREHVFQLANLVPAQFEAREIIAFHEQPWNTELPSEIRQLGDRRWQLSE